MSGWFLVERNGWQHVIPKDDIKSHAYAFWCKCKPQCDPTGAAVALHNSFDQRELKESDHLQ